MPIITTPYPVPAITCPANSVRLYKYTLSLLLAVFLPYYPAQAASSTGTSLTGSANQSQDRAAGKTGNAKPERRNGTQTLLLDVTVNTQKLVDIVRVEKLADGRLVLPVEAWLEARLRPSGKKLVLPDGSQGYALDAVPGL